MTLPVPDTPPAFARLLAQVEQIVRESGDAESARDFDAAVWLTEWLGSPAAVLGGRAPSDYLHTPEGVELVSALLGAQQSGAYW
jgi:uncharacterized protein (DUF2384 family)